MKNPLIITALILTVLGASSCDFDDDGPFRKCERGDGPKVEKVIDLPEFTGVRLNVDAKVHIRQDNYFEVVAKGEENIIDLLERKVRNNTWDIEFDRCARDYDLDIFITMPDIQLLSVSGSGEIIGDTFIEGDNIVLRLSGSGRLCLGLYAEKIDGRISGSGNMELEGECEKLDFSISGSGDLHAFGLAAQKANINISGSGNASVRVLEVLDVRISGSGKVYYKGNPIINANISGSGKVVNAN